MTASEHETRQGNQRAEILRKIRKLMNVTADGGSTEGEIENAIRMAAVLIDKHHVADAEVWECARSVDDVRSQMFSGSIGGRIGDDYWCRDLSRVIADSIGGLFLYHDGTEDRMVFAGDRTSVEAALDMFAQIRAMVICMGIMRYPDADKREKADQALYAMAKKLKLDIDTRYRVVTPKQVRQERIGYGMGFPVGLREHLRDVADYEARGVGAIVLRKAELAKQWLVKDKGLRFSQSRAQCKPYDESAYGHGVTDGRAVGVGSERMAQDHRRLS